MSRSPAAARPRSPHSGPRALTAASRRLRLVIVSTYPPRRCGLATFAWDLRDALVRVAPDLAVTVCALDTEGLSYPPEVEAVIDAGDAAGYRRAARLLAGRADAVLIEHEYGIFGGPHGAYVNEFAGELHAYGVPYLVTPHTVLSDPLPEQAATLAELCRRAAAVTVLTPSAIGYAAAAGIAAPERCVVTPHGAPSALRSRDRATAASASIAAVLAAAEGRRTLSTFGLLGPGKAIENALLALPSVVERQPDVRYVVAGATHPEERRRHGEAYRESLLRLVSGLGLAGHVVFVDEFLSVPDLAALLARTDVYVTPYRSREQISSGALTFAVAAGCPVVSTDYHYARDMLSGGAGLLVPVDDPAALAGALCGLLGDPARLAGARRAAEAIGAGLMWPAVARRVADAVRAAARTRVRVGAYA